VRVNPFQLLVKPVSADCNAACDYCFYLRVARHYPEPSHCMDDETLREMVSQFMSYGFPEAVFTWQGGEPTLAGLDFFQRVVEYEKKFGHPGQRVGNAFMTNGILVDEDWARFFAQYSFLVGLSLDGPEEVHNKYRKDRGGKGTFDRVMAAAELMRRHRVAFNILCVVSKANVDRAREVYKFYRDNNFQFLQFIPALEADPDTGQPAPFTMTAKEYGQFLCQLFDAWVEDGFPEVSIRDFDALLEIHLGQEGQGCLYGRSCGEYLLIEHNGDIYPCDFFVRPGWKLGNIFEENPLHLYMQKREKLFAKRKRDILKSCRECEWLEYCHGGCLKDREFPPNPHPKKTFLCPAHIMFLEHAKEQFDIWKRQYELAQI
jgi:uncharacterized protein